MELTVQIQLARGSKTFIMLNLTEHEKFELLMKTNAVK